MNSFWITVNLGGAQITAIVESKRIDELISGWEDAAAKMKVSDIRESSRQLVVEALMQGLHDTDKEIGNMVVQAVLWLTATGPLGAALLPILREGGANTKVHQEITEIGQSPGNSLYNFRTTLDAETSERIAGFSQHPWAI